LKGLVFDLQRYSIHDGPGIRTVVFLKGCPLNCLWCCNPESQRMVPELEFRSSLCRQCGKCISVCPETAIHPDVSISPAQKIDRLKCTLCGECAEICPYKALRISGEWMETGEVLGVCLKDADIFRRSTGGVTISGGEPLAQAEFSLQLLNKLHEKNIHTAIETTGLAAWETIQQFIPFTGLFLFDIKHTNPEHHISLTGISNLTILSNLEKLAQANAKIILRIPIVPGYNDDSQNILAVCDLAKKFQIQEIHLMPFHQFGKEKYVRFGYNYALHDLIGILDSDEGLKSLNLAEKMILDSGLAVQIGG
jgi:pyruvate formate lyase activating enzyme